LRFVNAEAQPAADSDASPYPVQLTAVHQEQYRRFLPFFKWLLLLPHYIVLIVLLIISYVSVLVAAIPVLLFRRYPKGLFAFNAGVQRWATRVNAYLFLMVDKYPPFSLRDKPDYPVRFTVEYPEHGIARWRPLFAWLLALPVLLVAGVFQYYLVWILVVFAFVTILFTKRFPKGMFNLQLGVMRLSARATAYTLFMVDRYPPFDI
jgi:hypothetical protein